MLCIGNSRKWYDTRSMNTGGRGDPGLWGAVHTGLCGGSTAELGVRSQTPGPEGLTQTRHGPAACALGEQLGSCEGEEEELSQSVRG